MRGAFLTLGEMRKSIDTHARASGHRQRHWHSTLALGPLGAKSQKAGVGVEGPSESQAGLGPSSALGQLCVPKVTVLVVPRIHLSTGVNSFRGL